MFSTAQEIEALILENQKLKKRNKELEVL